MHTSGFYICFVDADDVIDSKMIEFLVEYMEENDLITSDCYCELFSGELWIRTDSFDTGTYNTKEQMEHIIANMITFQNRFEDGILPFLVNKMYKSEILKDVLTSSVTEGRYILMVSSKGLEMYDAKMDPVCQNNIMIFFVYEDKILKSNERNADVLGFYFVSFWNSREQSILRQKFYELRDILYEKTLELYIAGGRSEKDMLDEMKFEKLNTVFG